MFFLNPLLQRAFFVALVRRAFPESLALIAALVGHASLAFQSFFALAKLLAIRGALACRRLQLFSHSRALLAASPLHVPLAALASALTIVTSMPRALACLDPF